MNVEVEVRGSRLRRAEVRFVASAAGRARHLLAVASASITVSVAQQEHARSFATASILNLTSPLSSCHRSTSILTSIHKPCLEYAKRSHVDGTDHERRQEAAAYDQVPA